MQFGCFDQEPKNDNKRRSFSVETR